MALKDIVVTVTMMYVLVNLSLCSRLGRLEKRLYLLESRIALDSFEFRQELEETKAVFNKTMDFINQNIENINSIISDKDCRSMYNKHDDFIKYRRILESGFRQLKLSVNLQLENHSKNIKHILEKINKLDARTSNIDENCRTGMDKYEELSKEIRDLEIRTQTKLSAQETSINEIRTQINEMESDDLKTIQTALHSIHAVISEKQDNTSVTKPMRKVFDETISLFLTLTLGAEVKCKHYEFKFKCYLIMTGEEPWEESKRKCNALKIRGHLPTVENDIEQEYLQTLSRNYFSLADYGVWLDGNDKDNEGTWVWSETSETITDLNTFWGTNEPNGGERENCMHLFKSKDYKWNDISCNRNMSFICVIDMSFIYK
ncbi:C-type lectin domain family 4 member M-like [Mya arenaria]|uniref:C-type lectin domain family 4 member M-like n=1 Tax=Mya arenaria TaxID=6604 RepID=UPI0022E11AEF|nr:C-type lectin domain family 4 member M-like [Mya arenaria]